MVEDAERRGRVLGYAFRRRTRETSSRGRHRLHVGAKRRRLSGQLPASLEIVHGNQVYIAKQRLHPALRNRLLRIAAFQNPEFYRAQAMRLSTYGKPRVIACAEDHPQHIALPRGCRDDVCHELTSLGIRPIVRDHREGGRLLDGDVHRRVESRADGRCRGDGVARHRCAGRDDRIRQDRGRRMADRPTPGEHAGARPPTPTPRSMGRAALDLSRSPGEGDRAGERRTRTHDGVDRCRPHTEPHPEGRRRRSRRRLWPVIVDECHHLSAQTFEAVVRQAKARYVVGLSATVTRKDGHHPIVTMQCGPVRHRVDAGPRPSRDRSRTSSSSNQPGSARGEQQRLDRRVEFQALYQELVRDASP